MTLSTYSALKTAIADFLNRDDLTTAIPTFIALAEARMNRELRTWRQETRVTVSLTGQYNAVIPADFAQPIRLQLLNAPTAELEPISVAQMLAMRADRNDRPGAPTNYAVTGGQLEIFPTPDDTYSASLVYYAKVPTLSDIATTNWLLTDAPDVYLYGALVHSAPYLKDDARLPVWETLHTSAVSALNTQSQNAKYGGTGLRMRVK
jgi:hypothetical protein